MFRAELLLLVVGLTGCGVWRAEHLGYQPKAEPPSRDAPINASLRVNTFADKRAQHEPAAVFTSTKNPVDLDGAQLCVNLEKAYAHRIPDDLAAVVTRNIQRRGVFAARDDRASAYVLDGSIIELVGRKAFGGQANVSIHFGELKLTETKTRKTKRLPDVTVDTADYYSINNSIPDCSTIFRQVNSQLEEAVGTLLMSVEWTARWWLVEPQPNVLGELHPEMIQRIVRENYGKFDRCYVAGLGRNPNLEGHIAVGFTVTDQGTVRSVEDKANTIPDQAVGACVREGFKTLSFPIPKGGIVTVVYPIMFSPYRKPDPINGPPPVHLSSDQVQNVIEKTADYAACGDRFSVDAPAGTHLQVKFRIEPAGNVSTSTFAEPLEGSPELRDCVERVTLSLHFPPAQRPTRVSYPFDFPPHD
jgi:hypothetical protein